MAALPARGRFFSTFKYGAAASLRHWLTSPVHQVSDGTQFFGRAAADGLLSIGYETTNRLVLADRHGDVIGGFDPADATLGAGLPDSRTYDPFGQSTNASGLKYRVGYQGDWTDPRSGDVNQGARWYNPGTGTFNSRDAISYDAGTASSVLNLYAYAGGNPLTFNDPDGHRAIDPGGGKLKQQCEWRYELVGDGHQWIYRCRWVGADDPVKPPPPTDGDGDGGCKKNCRGPGDGGDDDCKWNCGGPGDGGNGGAGEGGCKRNCGPKPPPKCDPQCQLTKKIKKERDDLEQEAKTIAQPPPGDPVCANGNPLCPTDPSRPATVVTSGGDLTNETANWSTEQYETALDSAGSVASDVSDTHKMSWLDRMNEYGLPGSHADVGDKFGQWFYDEHPELFHLSLDVLGLVPVVGEYFDGMNAGLYASEGDYGNAALSGSSAVPIAGWIPAVGKIGRKTFKFLTKGAEKCNSFEPGTRVEMADGSEKPIEDVKLGDWVAATDPLTGETSPQRVVATIVGIGAKRLVDIETVESKLFAPSFKSRIVATEGHPFYVESQNRWVDAIDLKPGDVLRDNESDVTVTVASARPRTVTTTVHNLTINKHHTYYVLAGETPVLVHNANCMVGTRQFDHAWDQHSHGGAYYKAGQTENVLAGGIDKTRFRSMVDEAIKNGTQVPRSKSDPRGGYYIDYDFGNVEVGAMGQNGIRIVVDGMGGFVTAMPRFIY